MLDAIGQHAAQLASLVEDAVEHSARFQPEERRLGVVIKPLAGIVEHHPAGQPGANVGGHHFAVLAFELDVLAFEVVAFLGGQGSHPDVGIGPPFGRVKFLARQVLTIVDLFTGNARHENSKSVSGEWLVESDE